MSEPRSDLRVVLSVVLVAIAGFAVGLSVTFLGAGVLELFGVTVFDDLVVAMVVSVIGQGIGFGLAALGYLRYYDYSVEFLRVRWPTRRDVAWTVGGLVLLFVAVAVLSGAIELLDLEQPADHEIAELAEEEPLLLLVLVPLSFLVIGPGEELLFRGVIQTRLVQEWGATTGIVATSVLFSLAHLGAYQGEGLVVSLIVLFSLSLILGWLYEHTDNLVVPAVVHGAYNAILFLGLYATL